MRCGMISGVMAAVLVTGVPLWGQTISTAVGGYIVYNQPALSTPLALPGGEVLDALGNLIIADTGNSLIRRVDASTQVATIIAGGGTRLDDSLPIAARTASIPIPRFVLVDNAGDILFSDFSGRVRKLTPDGMVTTVAGNRVVGYRGDGGPATAASLVQPVDVAFDPSGNLFIADRDANVVRKADSRTGIITTVADSGAFGYSGDNGPATLARLSGPAGLAVDAAGNLFVAESGSTVVRKVASDTGIITTVAGAYRAAVLGDGGLATLASLGSPRGLTLDAGGNLYISDEGNNRVRKVSFVPVTPVLAVAPTVLVFNALRNGTPPADQTFHVQSANFAAWM